MNMYVSFREWSDMVHVRFNRLLFEQDIMYFAKIWKAHRQNYHGYCQQHNVVSDYENYQNRLTIYEKRLLDIQYETGYMSDQQYRDALWNLQRKW